MFICSKKKNARKTNNNQQLVKTNKNLETRTPFLSNGIIVHVSHYNEETQMLTIITVFKASIRYMSLSQHVQHEFYCIHTNTEKYAEVALVRIFIYLLKNKRLHAYKMK